MKSVTNMNPAKKQITLDEQKKSNKLNDFYLRFERQNFSQECDRVLQSLPDTDDTCCLEVDLTRDRERESEGEREREREIEIGRAHV